MKELILKLAKEEDGASLIEYVLLAALIGVVAIAGMKLVGEQSNTVLDNTGQTLQNHAGTVQ